MSKSELALKLRKEGLTYREIGERLGVSRQRAHQLVDKAGQVPVFYKVCENCGAVFRTCHVKAKYCPRCRMNRKKFKRCKICGRRYSPDELVKNKRGNPTKLCKECALRVTQLVERTDDGEKR